MLTTLTAIVVIAQGKSLMAELNTADNIDFMGTVYSADGPKANQPYAGRLRGKDPFTIIVPGKKWTAAKMSFADPSKAPFGDDVFLDKLTINGSYDFAALGKAADIKKSIDGEKITFSIKDKKIFIAFEKMEPKPMPVAKVSKCSNGMIYWLEDTR